MICAFLTAEISALPSAQLSLARERQRRCPTQLTVAADREQSRGPDRFKSQPYCLPYARKGCYLVPHAMPNCDDYRAIPLTWTTPVGVRPQADRRTLCRGKQPIKGKTRR